MLIPRFSDRDGTSRPGSGSCRSRTRGGGKNKLGSISKQGDRYLHSLFTAGALAVIRYRSIRRSGQPTWAMASSNACF
ncbi:MULTISPECIES: transposase [Bradyrhizobium]|uniref:transposase n=1 Tax=Bradyrhizobium TaxID=374 RepID=UPI001FFAA157|nr:MULTISPECIES: transposase [Bradyrhizobium]